MPCGPAAGRATKKKAVRVPYGLFFGVGSRATITCSFAKFLGLHLENPRTYWCAV